MSNKRKRDHNYMPSALYDANKHVWAHMKRLRLDESQQVPSKPYFGEALNLTLFNNSFIHTSLLEMLQLINGDRKLTENFRAHINTHKATLFKNENIANIILASVINKPVRDAFFDTLRTGLFFVQRESEPFTDIMFPPASAAEFNIPVHERQSAKQFMDTCTQLGVDHAIEALMNSKPFENVDEDSRTHFFKSFTVWLPQPDIRIVIGIVHLTTAKLITLSRINPLHSSMLLDVVFFNLLKHQSTMTTSLVSLKPIFTRIFRRQQTPLFDQNEKWTIKEQSARFGVIHKYYRMTNPQNSLQSRLILPFLKTVSKISISRYEGDEKNVFNWALTKEFANIFTIYQFIKSFSDTKIFLDTYTDNLPKSSIFYEYFMQFSHLKMQKEIIQQTSKEFDKRLLSNPNFSGDPDILSEIFKKWESDPEFLKSLIRLSPDFYEYAPETISNDPEFLMDMYYEFLSRVDERHSAKYIDEYTDFLYGHPLMDDIKFVKQVIKVEPFAAAKASDRLRSDPEFVAHAGNAQDEDVNLFELNIPGHLLNDITFMTQAIHHGLDAMMALNSSDVIQDDAQLMMKLIKSNEYALAHASERLKNDKEFMLHALKHFKNHQTSLWIFTNHLGGQLKIDSEFLLQLIKEEPRIFLHLPQNVQTNADFVNLARIETPEVAQYIELFLQGNK